MAIETKTIYFEQGGEENTDETLRLAKGRAETLGIDRVVVASYTGRTGAKAAEVFEGSSLIVAAGAVGFQKPNEVAMREENRRAIEAAGGKVFHSGHSFGTLGRAVSNRFGTIQVDEIVAHVLRLFSQGVKVGCEIACMACDAGLLRAGEEAIAIAGTARGADSAIVLRPSNTHTFFETRILEIICKPRG